LSKLEIELKLAEDDYNRKMQLKEKNVISQQDYDLAASKVAGLKADIRKIVAQIEKSEIRAPFDGTLGLRYVSPGEVVTTSTVLAVLVQDDNLKLEFSVPERYAQHLRKGQKISFTSGNSSSRHSASVYAHDPSVDETTRSLKVRAIVTNRNRELLSGSFARVYIQLGGSGKTIIIPPQSLVPVLGGQSTVVVRSGKAFFQPVETGARSATEVEILSGLKHGDTVLVTGLLQVRKGMPLSVSIIE
jgi:membrane fusion protein (multidrug efflux system)